jgi:hypothetical protein
MKAGVRIAIVVAAVVAPAAAGSSSAPARSTAQNAWFPLKPGTVFVYRGTEDGDALREVVTVTKKTKVINGTRCTVVEDLLYRNGRLAERTTDWYWKDRAGNVWYFGEDTAELDAKGKVVSREGSWQAGRDGATPGVFMPAKPHPGFAGQQEHHKGHAEDRYRIVSLTRPVSVPYRSVQRAMLVEEFSPLEPGVLDQKMYVRGVGLVLERTVKGGNETLELVSIGKP